MTRIAALMPLLMCSTLACQEAYLDGAWAGQASCADDELYDVEARFDQSLESERVEGAFFVEFFLDLGVFGRYLFWERGEIDDGEWDPQSNAVSGKVIADDEQANGDAPDWQFDLEPTNDELTEIEGDFERLDADGSVVLACNLELDKAVDPQN